MGLRGCLMHSKPVNGSLYYYMSVRKNGKVTTIYLGRDRKRAKEKESALKARLGIEKLGRPFKTEHNSRFINGNGKCGARKGALSNSHGRYFIIIPLVFLLLAAFIFFRVEITGFITGEPGNFSENMSTNETSISADENIPIEMGNATNLNVTNPEENPGEKTDIKQTEKDSKKLEKIKSGLESRLGIQILSISDNGNTQDMEFAFGDSKIKLTGVNPDELTDIQEHQIPEAQFSNRNVHLNTQTIVLNSLQLQSAEITLVKTGPVNAILKCSVFEGSECLAWERTEIPFDDFGDNITFNVTGFSGYAGAYITIINVQSYPTVGGEWIVEFNTTGVANLTISASNGTTYGTSPPYDLEWLSLKCGMDDVPVTFDGNSVYSENWNCSNSGYQTVRALTEGAHTQRFVFGDDVQYAHNWAKEGNVYNCSSCSDCNDAINGASAGDIIQLNVSVPDAAGTCIVVLKSDVVIDGNGFSITGDGTGYGVNITGFNNVTVKNFADINNFTNGIFVANALNATISNNTVQTWAASGYGIYIENTSQSNLTGNIVATNGSTAYGFYLIASSDNNLTGSTANTNGYDASGFYTISSSNNNLTGSTANTNGSWAYGFYIRSSSNNIVKGATANTNGSDAYGFSFWSSSNNNITDAGANTKGNNARGFWIYLSSNNNIITSATANTNGSNAYGFLLESSSNNTVSGATANTNGTGANGFYLWSSSNNNVSGATANTYGTGAIGFWLSGSSNNNVISGATANTNGSDGAGFVLVSSNNTVSGATANTNGSTAYGFYLWSSSNNNISGATANTNGTGGFGFYLDSSSNNNVLNGSMISTTGSGARGIYLLSSSNNSFIGSNLSTLATDTLFLSGASSANNTFQNITIINTNASTQHLNISTAGINGTTFVDMDIGRYSITGAGGTMNFRKTGFGEINFTLPVNGSGTNLSADVQIAYNYAFANITANPGLNRSANIALIGLPGSRPNPGILKDGVACPASVCSNLTAMSATAIVFNVTSWSNYTTASQCGYLGQENATYYLTNNVSSNGTCFTIMANKVTLDGQGFRINYSANGSDGQGINVTGYNSSVLRNLVIIQGNSSGTAKNGISVSNANNVSIVNNSITTTGTSSLGIYVFNESFYAEIRNNTINTSGASGYGIYFYTSCRNGVIANNNVTTNGNNAHGMYFYYMSGFHAVENNTVSAGKIGANGIRIELCTMMSLNNNTVTSLDDPYTIRRGISGATFVYNHTISESNLANGKAVKQYKGAENILVENNASWGALIIGESNNVTIRNVSLSAGGIQILGVTNAIVTNVTHTGVGEFVYAENAPSLNVSKNLVNRSSGYGYGVYLENNASANISGNVFTGTLNRPAIYAFDSPANITYNTINTYDTGIYLRDANGAQGSEVRHNILTIRSSSSDGIYVYNTGSSAYIIENNTINMTSASSADGIDINPIASVNVTIANASVTTNCSSCRPLRIGTSNINLTMIDSRLEPTGWPNGLYIGSTNTGSWNLTNVTRANGSELNVSWTAGANGTLNYGWWLDAYANYSNGSAANNVNVSAYDNNSVMHSNALTNATGLARFSLLEYSQTDNVTKTYYSNYTINATLVTATFASSVNLSTNRQLTFTFDSTSPAATLGTNPTDLFGDSDGSITFDLKCSDDVAVNTLQLWGNWSGGWAANATNSTPVNDSYWNVTVIGIPDGVWKWAAWCNDSAGNGNWSAANRTFTVDLTAPSVFFVQPTENDSAVLNSNWSFVNVTVTDAYNTSAFIDWNRSLVGWWTFNENDINGTTVFDRSSHGNNGTFGSSTIPALVQHAYDTPQSTNATSAAATFAGAQTAGDLIIAAVGFNNEFGSSEITSVTDTSGNIYQKAAEIAGNGLTEVIFYVYNISAASAGANTVTATFDVGGVAYPDLRISEWSGIISSYDPFDKNATGTGTNNYSVTGNTTQTSQATELVFASGMTSGSFTNAGATFAYIDITSPNSDIHEYKIVYRTGQFEGSAQMNDDYNWAMSLATFKAVQNVSITDVSGKLGQASHFTSSFADAGIIPELISAPQVTLMGWFKKSTNGSYIGIGNQNQFSWNDGITLEMSEDGTVYSALGDGNPLPPYGSFNFSDTQWHHLSVVFDGTLSGDANRLKIYMDGVQQSLTFGGSGGVPATTYSTAADFCLGGAGPYPYGIINGSIDDVMIFTRPLSSEEINATYNAGLYRLAHNFTSLANGNYTFRAYAQDAAGNVNSTEERTVTVQTTTALACGQTLTQSVTLTQNLTSADTCLTVGASNIVIDGAGFIISGNGTGYGVNITGFNNVTVRNFAGINNFTYGVSLNGSVNSTLFNNSIAVWADEGTGIQLQFSNYTNISGGFVMTNSSYSTPGFYLFNSHYNTIDRNVVNIFGFAGTGLLLENASHNNITDVNVSTFDMSAYAFVLVYSESSNNLLRYTNANTEGTWAYAYEISATNNTLIDAVANTEGFNGEAFWIVDAQGTNITNAVASTGNGGGHGVYLQNANNTVLNGANILTRGDNAQGYMLFDSNNNFASGVNVTLWGNYAIAFSVGGANNTITGSSANTNGSDAYGIDTSYPAIGNLINMTNVSTSGAGAYGFHVSTAAVGTTVKGGMINTSAADSIHLDNADAANCTFMNVAISNANVSTVQLNISTAGINGTTLVDMDFGRYSIAGTGGKVNFRKTGVGEINFTQPINGSGTNLSSDVQIGTGWAYVNSTANSGLSRSANVTLYGMPGNFVNPLVLKDGVPCGSGCHNFTSLNAATVVFNVTGWSNYTIANGTQCGYVNANLMLWNSIGSNGTCFTVNASDVVIDGAGFTITGDGSGLGVNVTSFNNVTVKNFAGINNYSNGIFANNSLNITIFNNSVTTWVNNGHGIYLINTGQSNLTSNNITTNGSSARGFYLSSSSNNSVSGASATTNGSNANGFYLSSSSNNSVSGASATTNGSSAFGFLLSSSSNNTFSGVTATINGGTAYGFSLSDSSNNNITDAIANTNGTFSMGFILSTSSNNNITGARVNTTGRGGIGIELSSSDNNVIMSAIVNTNSNISYGFYLWASSNNSITNLIANTNESYGVFVRGSSDNYFSGGNITTLAADSIRLFMTTSFNNTFRNVSIVNTNASTQHLNISDAGINGTTLVDMDVGRYSIAGAGGKVNIRKTGIGEINFTSPINGSGSNLSNDVQMGVRWAYVNGSQAGLNRSANVTLYNMPQSFAYPLILKDGQPCGSQCHNFTNLNAATVVFNVSGWSNYTIANGTQCGYVNTNLTLWNSIGSNGTCFIVNASNVIIDGAGFTISGNGTDYGINITGFNNVTVKNFAGINNFSYGIYALNSVNSTILSNIIQTWAADGYGVFLNADNMTNITGNNITTNGSTAYAIFLQSSSNNNIIGGTANTSGTNGYAVYLDSSSNNNLITAITINTFGGWGYGFYLSGSSKNNVISNSIANINGNNAIGFYLWSYSNNNSFTNITANTNGTNSYGLMIDLSGNNSVTNSIANTNGSAAYGFYLEDASSNNVTNSTANTNGINGWGFYLKSSSQNKLANSTANSNGSNSGGFYFESSSNYNIINNNSANTGGNGGIGFYLSTSSNNNLTGNTANTNGSAAYGHSLSFSANNLLSGGWVSTLAADSIYLIGASTANNTFQNISIINTNTSTQHLNISTSGINGTTLIDMDVGSYMIAGAGGKMNFRKTGIGAINFTSPVNGSGADLSADVTIAYNYTFVNSAGNPGLNRSANIILYGLWQNFQKPAILRDGLACPAGICINYTPLNAENVSFSVNQWTNYSIGENPDIPPVASIGTNPADSIYDSDGTVTFDLKCSDDVAVNTLQLWGNWSGSWVANQTNSTPTNDGWWNVTVAGIPEGTWRWGAWCNDSAYNGDWPAANRTFTVDLTNPVSYLGVNPLNNFTDSDGSVTFDLKCSDGAVVSTLQLWGNWSGSWAMNQTNSAPLNDTWWNVTVAGIPEGVWKWGADCNDSANRSAIQTENRTLKVDLNGPSLGNRYMNRSGKAGPNSFICINVSGVSDMNLQSVWATITQPDGSASNVTMNDTGSCAGSAGDGWFSASVNVGSIAGTFWYNATYANDSLGRVSMNGTPLQIEVDVSPPAIAVLSPLNMTYNKSSIWFNVTADEQLSGCVVEYGPYNWYKRFDAMANTSGNWNYNNNSLFDAVWDVRFHCNDTVGNLNDWSSTALNFTIDTVPPAINIINPANASTKNDSFYFNYSEANCTWYSLDAAENVTNCSVYPLNYWTGLFAGLTDGPHNLTVWVNDSYGNTNSATRFWARDTSPPAITISSPLNATYTSYTVYLNVTADEPLSQCVYRIDSGGNSSMSNSSAFNWSAVVSPGEGAHNLYVFCNDTAGNTGINSSIWFTRDTQAPVWSGNSTNARAVYSSNTQSCFNITWQENVSGIDTVYIQGNWSGSGVNYTVSNLSSSQFYYCDILPAGTFYWLSLANDTNGLFNYSSSWVFSVNKASNPVSLFLNGTLSNMTTTYGNVTNATGYSAYGTQNLYRNGQSTSNPEVLMLGAGTHDYVLNTTGDQNHTANSTIGRITVLTASTEGSLFLNSAQANLSINYSQSVNVSAYCNPGALTLYMNSSPVSNPFIGIVSSGTFMFHADCDGDSNHSASEKQYLLIVNKTLSSITLLINGTDGDILAEKGSTINVTALLSHNQTQNFYIYQNYSMVKYGFSPLENFSYYSILGYYNITANCSESENYTSAVAHHMLTIVDTTPPSLDFVSPTPYNQSNVSTSWIFVNVSGNEILGGCVLRWFNGSWQNLSMDDGGMNCYINMTGLAERGYRFLVFGNDTEGNVNVTTDIQATVNFSTDNVAPTLDFVPPTLGNASTTTNNWIAVNVSANENLSVCLLSWSNGTITNVSMAVNGISCYALMQGLSQGYYYFKVFANDSTGNMNASGGWQIRYYVAPSQPPAGGGPSGGGAIPSSPPKANATIVNESREIITGTRFIYLEMYPGDTTSTSIFVKNNQKLAGTFTTQFVGNAKDFVTLMGPAFAYLMPGSGEYHKIQVSIPGDAKQGIYSGEVSASGGGVTDKIPVTIKVLEKKQGLLDLKIDALKTNVKPGDTGSFEIKLYNLGKTGRVDVQLRLQIYDPKTNETIAEKVETLAVETSLSSLSTIAIPIDSREGDYEVRATASYTDSSYQSLQAIATTQITVRGAQVPWYYDFAARYWWALVLMLIGIIIAYLYLMGYVSRHKN
jgi:parallel beta-helix repeat protein